MGDRRYFPTSPDHSEAEPSLLETDFITRPADDINTVYDVLTYSSANYGHRMAIGWREVVGVVEEQVTDVDRKDFTENVKQKYFHLSEYKYMSFAKLDLAVSEVARGLLTLGITDKDIINIYAPTSPGWQFIAHACGSISVTIVPTYDTSDEAGLLHTLNDPKCTGIYTESSLLRNVLKVLPKSPEVEYIIFDGEGDQLLIAELTKIRHVKVMSLFELRLIGKSQCKDILEKWRPNPKTTACIMYTSGTTGIPKGVVLRHSQLIAGLGGAYTDLKKHLQEDDRYLAYLPLAHIFEYLMELIMLFSGICVGYGRIGTLIDEYVRNCRGDVAAFKPSILGGVPVVWESIRKGIVSSVNQKTMVERQLFQLTMSIKNSGISGLSAIADKVLANNVKKATGGKLRLGFSGGAILSKQTQKFLNTALVQMIQTYGMTESCGLCCMRPPSPNLSNRGSDGVVTPSVEVELRDVPEMDFLPGSSENSRGEICIRGPSVAREYLNRSDLNENETIFTKDGWFRTGDLGQWNADRTLSVIDRLGNIVKLKSGEYVASGRLVSVYKSCNFVRSICLHIPPDNFPIAIIVPQEKHIRNRLKGKYSNYSVTRLCGDEKVKELVLEECNIEARKNGYKGAALLLAVILTPDEWTSENGFRAASQKIRKDVIIEAFKVQIMDVYDEFEKRKREVE